MTTSSFEFNNYPIEIKKVPTFYFIGVTTRQSSIMKIFPLWMRELGRPEISIEGIDLKIHDDPEIYRQVVAQIKFDPQSLGALVTTHKIDVLTAARVMVDYLDPYALICNEISCISKVDGMLQGHAKDPISAGLSLDDILGRGYFGKTHVTILCFGAGGSGVATALHVINKKDATDRPEKFIVVNRSQERLTNMEKMVDGQNTSIQFEYICNSDPAKNDAIMSSCPDTSVVINATGMGKDSPGSPITDNGLFPMNGVAWEFNYRGELDFMHQALAQQKARNMVVEDGWLYFIHGWTQVISQVLHIPLDEKMVNKLAEIAEIVRPQKAEGLRR
jgi:shikimate 5-dehydrogenase